MNPKFYIGHTVYFKDEEFIVIRMCDFSIHKRYIYYVSECANPSRDMFVYEEDLLSKSEWEVKQQGNQNNVVRKAFSQAWKRAEDGHRIMGNTPIFSDPKCVCGAHKVNSPRHSSWCEIEE